MVKKHVIIDFPAVFEVNQKIENNELNNKKTVFSSVRNRFDVIKVNKSEHLYDFL